MVTPQVTVTIPPPPTHDPIEVSSQAFGPQWRASICTLRNSRADCWKPNEGFVVVDPTRQSVALADGITRTKSADGSYPIDTPSAQAAQLFCHTVSEYLRNTPQMSIAALTNAITTGNQAIALFNKDRFPVIDYAYNDMAGVAAVVGVVDNDTLWIASIADCICLSADPLCVRPVAWEKTSHSTAEYNRLGETEARKTLRNNRASLFAYGALTGEETALPFVSYVAINIKHAHRIVFASDGLLELARRSPSIFQRSSATEIMRAACVLETELGITDDKTVVVLDRCSARSWQ